jgi:hypothetical protein
VCMRDPRDERPNYSYCMLLLCLCVRARIRDMHGRDHHATQFLIVWCCKVLTSKNRKLARISRDSCSCCICISSASALSRACCAVATASSVRTGCLHVGHSFDLCSHLCTQSAWYMCKQGRRTAPCSYVCMYVCMCMYVFEIHM